MATYPTRTGTNNHSLRKTFLKVAACSVLLFGSYQFYVPDGAKDAVGQKVESITGSKAVGHVFGTLHPWEKPVVQVNLPKPGN
ncbi:MAG: hypothetical protein ACAH83_00570 [Alphaproteobacteria bacterium]